MFINELSSFASQLKQKWETWYGKGLQLLFNDINNIKKPYKNLID